MAAKGCKKGEKIKRIVEGNLAGGGRERERIRGTKTGKEASDLFSGSTSV